MEILNICQMNQIMAQLKCKPLVQFSDILYHVSVNVTDLLDSPLFKNWGKNRPPNKKRVREIANCLYTKKQKMTSLLVVSYSTKDKKMYIMDGIHRIEALKLIYKNNRKPANLIEEEESEYGSNRDAHWFYEQQILLNIHFNLDEGENISLFQLINKSVSVPDLYVQQTTDIKRLSVQKVVSIWAGKYKKHFSKSVRPNLGQTNVDRFTDLVSKVFDALVYRELVSEDVEAVEAEEVEEEINGNIIAIHHQLELFNGKIKADAELQIYPPRVTEQMKNKSAETGCYLFWHGNEMLERMLA